MLGHQKSKLKQFLLITTFIFQCTNLCFNVESKCHKGCPLALASYYVWLETNLTFIAQVLNASVNDALSYNPSVPDEDRLQSFVRINIPFSCDCINGEFLGHTFQYQVQKGDTYNMVAGTYYSNLTTVSWMEKFNGYSPTNVPEKAVVNVPVNCSCGDSSVSEKYGLFLTYPLRPEDDLRSVAQETNSSTSLLERYNPNVDFSAGSGLVFLPAKDKTGEYPPLTSSSGMSSGAIAGISVAIVAGLTILAVLIFVLRRNKKESLLLGKSGESSTQIDLGNSRRTGGSSAYARGAAGKKGMTVNKSVEFTYEELAHATNDFSIANKIGAGGFGAVYFAELRGEETDKLKKRTKITWRGYSIGLYIVGKFKVKKAAVKKMDMKASKEFLAEINVLTRAHHLNLVRLIGYCVEQSLFLVYEYVENGNLSQHLHGSGRERLPWSTRVQIALDAARGLIYIHEHTVPVYIHRDIKSANILIDKSFHAKVADFGLTKLTEVGAASAFTRLVGTFGYMSPEYAQFGEVSANVDVYAFGVVLYELISAKEAVVKGTSGPYSKPLVDLFENVLNQPDASEIQELVDPRLGDNYPLTSVLKMAELAMACTQENPKLRPSMRSVVVALMTLSSAQECDFYEKQGLII